MTTTTPCENPSCGAGYYMPSHPRPPEKRRQIEQPARGRRRHYCSDACRQMVYRERAAERERAAQRAATIKKHHRRLEQAEGVVTHVINDVVHENSRLSTTQRKALVQRIVRQLALAHLINLDS